MQKLLLIALWFVAAPALADIVQPQHTFHTTLASPFGQSFTATAAEFNVGSVSFLWGPVLNPAAADPVMSVELRSGVGFAGALLASTTLPAIPDSTPANSWIDFVFDSPVALTSSQSYTIRFANTTSDSTVTGTWGRCTDINFYLGGDYINSSGSLVAGQDLAFRVLGVPEPATLTLASVWLASLPIRRRKSVSHNRA